MASALDISVSVRHLGERDIRKSIVPWKTVRDHTYGTGMFAGITSPVKVARYHSLAVQMDDLPECLTVMAQTKDGEIMAMQHKEYPVIGLQFHPESIYTEHGKRMVENFINGIN